MNRFEIRTSSDAAVRQAADGSGPDDATRSQLRAGCASHLARTCLLGQLAVQDSVGTLLPPFHDPRNPKVVPAPAPRLPL